MRAHSARMNAQRTAAEGFAAQREHGQRQPCQQTRRPQLGKHRRRGVDHVDAVLGDGRDQRLGVGLGLLVDDVHGVAVEQRDQRLPGRVERERPCVRDAQRTAQSRRRRSQHVIEMVVGVSADRGVGSDDALGFSGCSRREHHVGGVLRIDLDRLEVVGIDVGGRSQSSMTIVAPLCRRIELTRSAGIPGSNGTYVAPALSAARIATTYCGPRASLMATGVSALRRAPASAQASRLAASSSSR